MPRLHGTPRPDRREETKKRAQKDFSNDRPSRAAVGARAPTGRNRGRPRKVRLLRIRGKSSQILHHKKCVVVQFVCGYECPANTELQLRAKLIGNMFLVKSLFWFQNDSRLNFDGVVYAYKYNMSFIL